MTDGLILEGNVSDINLATFLMSLYKNKETGILVFDDGSFPKALYIKEGNVVFASSKSPDDRLGESLLRSGKISVKDYISTSKLIRPGKRMGELLIDAGILTPEEMVQGVNNQLNEIIDSIFAHATGHYCLELDDFSTENLMTLSIEMPTLLYNGMKRVRSWKMCYSAVGSPEQRVKRADDLPSFFSLLELSPDEEHLLSLTTNGMPVGALIEASYLSQFDTYNLLWIFLTLGLIKKEAFAGNMVESSKGKNLEELIEDHNDVYLYYFSKLGGSAEGTFKEAFDLLSGSFPNLLDRQEGFYSYGRLDPDLILSNLRSLDEQEKSRVSSQFLEELLYSVAFFAQKKLDKYQIDEINEYLKTRSSLSNMSKGA
jgi:hypothetical protein